MNQVSEITATGRRKTSVAAIRLKPGSGRLVINGRTLEEYFPSTNLQNVILQVFEVTNKKNAFDVYAKVVGGGVNSQAGALRLAVARGLLQSDESLRVLLREHGLLTRDPRMKERKKSGQPGARKRFQFSKR
jgi:small subunit ribosomal protein S9